MQVAQGQVLIRVYDIKLYLVAASWSCYSAQNGLTLFNLCWWWFFLSLSRAKASLTFMVVIHYPIY